MRKILLILVTGLFLAWFLLLRPAFLGGPAGYIMVTGVSMEPTLYTGDLVVVHRQDSYDHGDIVAFRVQGGNVIHRIVGGSPREGFVMQGDNKKGPDPWRPTPEQILGKIWIHLSGWGRTLAYLRQPLPLAMTVTTMALLSLAGSDGVRRQRRRGGRMVSRSGSGTIRRPPEPIWAVVALGLVAALGIGLVAAAGYAFWQPLQQSQFLERARYQHSVAFEYMVQEQPSTLHPDGAVGPVLAPSDPAAKVSPPPIFTRLARTLDLRFTYSLSSSLPADVEGEMGAILEIKAGENGWTWSEELVTPAPFDGSTASAWASVDLVEVLSLIETIQRETGLDPGSYTLSIVPTVRVKGRLGQDPIDDSYTAAFPVRLTRSLMVPDAQLVRSGEARKIGETVTREQQIVLGGLAAPVVALRWAGVVGTPLCLLVASGLAAFLFLGLGRSEDARVQARYGSMLISVARANLKPETERVEVASMADLARLARRDGQTIFHQSATPDSHLYFIHHGDVVYSYTVGKSSEEEE